MLPAIAIVLGAVFVASQDQIAFLVDLDDGDTVLYSLDAGTGEAAALLDAPGARGPLRWSPDGRFLAFAASGVVQVYDVETGTATPVTHSAPLNAEPDWSPDGGRLAYVTGAFPEGRITVYDIGNKTETVWANGATGFAQPNWFNESHLVAVQCTGEPGKRTLDLLRVFADRISLIGESRVLYAPHAEWRPMRHPSKDLVAYESNEGGDREVYILAPGFGNLNASNHRSADINPVWDATGEWLLFESFRGGTRGVYRVSPRHLIVIPVAVSDNADHWAASPAPSGSQVACVSNGMGAAKLTVVDGEGKVVRILDDLPGVHRAPAWRPEARP
jgi:TolB protein